MLDNSILAGLPVSEAERLQPYLAPVSWQRGEMLRDKGEAVSWVIFPESGLLSCLLSTRDGMEVEMGMAGRTGMMDSAPALVGGHTRFRTMGQIAGTGWRLPASVLRDEFWRGGEFGRRLLRYLETRMQESSQYVLCNRSHTTEERLARWLLQTADGIEALRFELPQSFIAAMLGTRLSGATVAVSVLWRSGMIECDGDVFTIPDRAQLEACACSCYAALKQREPKNRP